MRTFLVLFLAVFLTACGSTRVQRDVVTESRTVVVKIPGVLLTKCDVSEPISKSRYIQLKAEDKEKELTDLIIKLYGDMEKCNGKIMSIKEFQDRIVKENEGKL